MYLDLKVFIGSGLVGFELNRISLDQMVRFFRFFLRSNYNLDSVRFENFQNQNNRNDRIFKYFEFGIDCSDLFLNIPIYFLSNCFKYFNLFVNIPIYFLIYFNLL